MKWTSPEVKGDLPAPRDSHTAVAIENNLFVYGGDCGDRYHGEVEVLDLDTLTWSRLAIQGSSPGFRAGHAAINIGSKVYVIGGVGDKQYYSDVWVLDLLTCSWAELDICGQQPHVLLVMFNKAVLSSYSFPCANVITLFQIRMEMSGPQKEYAASIGMY